MKKCLIVGKFAIEDKILDGQTVKCKTIYDELVIKYGESNISILDTYKWKQQPIKLFFRCIKSAKNHENIIMLPAHNGVKVFAPFLAILKKIYHKNIYYIVIGSWLYEKVKSSKKLKKSLLVFNNIYVETSSLKKQLESIGFKNVLLMRNYKKLTIVDLKKIKPFEKHTVFKMCIFSRINREKGILDAINTIRILKDMNYEVTLDIYGMIEKEFELEFKTIVNNNKDIVKYIGIINSSESVNVIKKYDVLLFPTRYYTEGIPGTIIDSFASGVPVIASSWENCGDIITDNKTGLIFEFGNIDDFKSKIIYAYNNRKIIYKMKKECINDAKRFCSVDTLNPLFKALDGENDKNN